MTASMERPTLAGRALQLSCAVTLAVLVTLLTACAPGGAPAGGASGQVGSGPRLAFKERAHDFGRLSASRTTEYRFSFTNAGSETLQIGEITLAPGGPGG